MNLETLIEKLNDIYYEEENISVILEIVPGEYKKIDFINKISNDKGKKFVVLS